MFAQKFARWDIKLPALAVSSRERGTIRKAGWTVRCLFGRIGDSEYLDYFAYHRMTDCRHMRIHESGEIEELEAPREHYGFRPDADGTNERRAFEEFVVYNKTVRKMLRAKGFIAWD